MDYLITTSSKADVNTINKALQYSQQLAIPYLPRNKAKLETIVTTNPEKKILVVEKERNLLIFDNTKYFFHPSMAKLRIKAIRDGQTDQMVEAMGLESGDSVLDCTLGLATDAIVASFVTGGRGKVVGIEGVDVLALIVKEGLRTYVDDTSLGKEGNALEIAMRRIEVQNWNHQDYLFQVPDKSFDIVYFDPMFKSTLKKSSGIQALKPFSWAEPLGLETIARARSVARKRVVIKERTFSLEFQRLGCNRVVGGKYSKVAFGIIDT